ncbi:ABC transporter permease [Dactylosporangium salmoneum]|uniref:ABC transmembrane type-1 domain-containing protein n=1 Tax=Dactylosporangium salmoneum TaxID=53361 RepID=A0ABP5TCZ0_9ACTN
MTATKIVPSPTSAETGRAKRTERVTQGRSLRGPELKKHAINTVGAIAVVAVLAGLWEGYKALGQAVDDVVPGTKIRFPVATDDLSMPHLSTILHSLIEPARRGDSMSLAAYLIGETTVTLREAFYGLVAGSVLGLLLAVVFLNVVPLSKGLMPWLVASQTVPLVAIAPMIVIWGGKAGAPPWIAVTGIAAYLAFFPVTINTLRGLKSPQKVHLELMHSVGAKRRQVLWWLRIPAALPFMFAGLRLAATASVVGAIVGELSAGTGRGIGRSILTFAYYYSNGPEKLYAAVLVSAVAGIVFVQLLGLIERFALRHRHA